MNENKHILTDKDLMELSESVPMAEGGTMDAFISEAMVVKEAVEAVGIDLQKLRSRSKALFLMRTFYLLGVLRGGEAYRDAMCLEDDVDIEIEECPFSLDQNLAVMAAKELDNPGLDARKTLVEILLRPWGEE